jgi:hypothetical protein
MWREYLKYIDTNIDIGVLFATAVAVTNGILAVIVALMPARWSVVRLRMGLVAFVLAAGVLAATVYLQYQGREQAEQRRADRRDLHERLETLILEGRTLLVQIRDSRRELPIRPADEWAQRAEIYLREKLGERYVAQFRKEVSDLYGDAPVPAERLGYWRAVRNRVVNLERISAEFPPVGSIATE